MYIKSDLYQVASEDSSREGENGKKVATEEIVGERGAKEAVENAGQVDSVEERGKGEKMEEGEREVASEAVLEGKETGKDAKEQKKGDTDVVLTVPSENSCCLVPQ